MDDEDSQGDLAKKRTARVQLANGAMEARAYVAPTPVPLDSDHKTIEMRTVAVDERLDPRRKATVARGMGEALAVLDGEIVDPATGRVIPAVDPRAVPNTPWAQGKRPTHLKGIGVPRIDAPRTGGAAAAKPGYGVYIAAGAIVVAAIACAGLIIATRGNTKPPAQGMSAAPSAPAPPAATTSRVLEPPPVEPPPTASAPATDSAPSAGSPPKVPTAVPPGKVPPPAVPPSAVPPPAKSSGRIF